MKVDYQQVKDFFEKHKMKFMLGAAFVLVFFAGFGTGRYEKIPARELKSYTNNSTKPTSKQTTDAAKAEGDVAAADASDKNQEAVLGTTTQASNKTCKIKGNISSKSKIYHVPGGAFYKTVTPEMCFSTEAEAVAAGFRKSGR
jgi:hypothetical protein